MNSLVKKMKDNIEKKNVFMLIDCSGSMMGSPIETALDAAYITTMAVKEAKSNSNVISSTFGSNNRDLKRCSSHMSEKEIEKFFSKQNKVPASSTHILPETDFLSQIMEIYGKSQPAELIIITDGEFSDSKVALKDKFKSLLADFPQLQINIFNVEPPRPTHKTYMKKLSDALEEDNVAVKIKDVYGVDELLDAITEAINSDVKTVRYPSNEIDDINNIVDQINDNFNEMAEKIQHLEEKLDKVNKRYKAPTQGKSR